MTINTVTTNIYVPTNPSTTITTTTKDHETRTEAVAPSNPQHESRTESTVNQVLPIDVGPMGNSFVLSDDECSE